MKEVLLSVKAVKSMHSLHLWALTLGQALVSVHLAIGNDVILTVFFFIVEVNSRSIIYCREVCLMLTRNNLSDLNGGEFMLPCTVAGLLH